ncbi:minor capsid protein [Parafrankia sp. EUN1f]|uniref:minor capsid protein n=1 Tax=Parafrankia sp. EUN1f TaxID=102897 RepID=UPI0001C46CE7|nr:minor capsid protein [Parafrankia sp. EUN1f]EFC80250.1 hypothetical protein FrEUN1fDRAFT_6644 [Parafrankia sp. EUN1f]
MLSAGVAELLGTTVPGLSWEPGGIYADTQIGVTVEQLPTSPDLAVAVLTATGGHSDSALPWDNPGLQVRVRGDRDPRTSWQIAKDCYSALQGLENLTLPDGTWLGLAVCDGQPIPSAPDESGRWQWVITVTCDIAAPTAHRY